MPGPATDDEDRRRPGKSREHKQAVVEHDLRIGPGEGEGIEQHHHAAEAGDEPGGLEAAELLAEEKDRPRHDPERRGVSEYRAAAGAYVAEAEDQQAHIEGELEHRA